MSFWTAERDADLVKLMERGYSANQIGQVLGCSRNAVIGRVHRLEAKRGEITRKRATPSSGAPRRYTPRKPSMPKAPILTAADARLAAVRERRAPPVAPTGKPTSIVDTTGCRFAVTEDMPHMFCNSTMREGSSYCPYHHEIVYVRKQA